MKQLIRTRGALAARLAVVVAVVLTGLATVGLQTSAHAAPQPLVGLFGFTAGAQTGTKVATGTYFRMLQPGGGYLSNGSSRAADKSYTILKPGTDGGLLTGAYQGTADPGFDASGNALSGRVTAPEGFFGVKFSTATNAVDPQTGHAAALPAIYADGTALTGDLSAFAASWNNQHFNQGAPKPDGTVPGQTQAVSGTYNASTKAYTLTWRSLIIGGPFNGFTGEWHLAGTFVPAPSITTAALPNGLAGKAYSASLAGTGGKTSYVWTIASGNLPAGLKLSTAGKITGTPVGPGSSSFTVKLTDATKPAKQVTTKGLSIAVDPVTVNAVTLPSAVVGKAITTTKLTATGGKATLVWTVSQGTLPAGLKLATSGSLSGTPTTAGTSAFTVQVADASTPKNIAIRELSLTVAPFTVATVSLPAGKVATTYPTTKLTANGGKGTLVWTVVAGALPPGVKLSTSGSLSGKPTVAGSYTFTVQVADGSSPKNVATKTFTLVVES